MTRVIVAGLLLAGCVVPTYPDALDDVSALVFVTPDVQSICGGQPACAQFFPREQAADKGVLPASVEFQPRYICQVFMRPLPPHSDQLERLRWQHEFEHELGHCKSGAWHSVLSM